MKYWKHVKNESWLSRKSAEERAAQLQKQNPDVQYSVKKYKTGAGFRIVKRDL